MGEKDDFKRQTFLLAPDVYRDLHVLAAEMKAEAAREGQPLRAADGISDIGNAALRREIDKVNKAKK